MKTVAYYMTLPYTTVLCRYEDNDVIAHVEELPGCVGHGRDDAEAIEDLRDMQKLWLEDCIEAGHAVPVPASESVLLSGKWAQRVPRSFDRRLVQMAKHENVSLNQLVTSWLSHAPAEAFGKSPPGACRSGVSLARPRGPAFTGSAGKMESAGKVRGGQCPLRRKPSR